MKHRSRLAAAAAGLVLLAAGCGGAGDTAASGEASAEDTTLQVFAAASLQEPRDSPNSSRRGTRAWMCS